MKFYQSSVLRTDVASVLAQFDVALEEHVHGVGEFEGLEEGIGYQRHALADSGRLAGLLPRSHQFLLEDTSAAVGQSDGIGAVSIVSDAVLDVHIEARISLDEDDHGQSFADLDQSIGGRGQRSLADLHVHDGRGCVSAEADHLRVQHVHVEHVRDRLLQRTFPQAAQCTRRVPDLSTKKFRQNPHTNFQKISDFTSWIPASFWMMMMFSR